MVIMPWLVNIVLLMKLLPANIADRLGQMIGAHQLMSDFTGKGDISKRIPGINDK